MTEWMHCPVCGNRKETILKNDPLYCPKCRQETLIEAKNLQETVIERLDVKTQS